jgi:sulfite reductase (NADPH) flavoprotein alpha-component
MSDMLAATKLKALQELVTTSSKEELIWMSGYIAGILAGSGSAAPREEAAPVKASVGKITIAYGTETGNSKKLASGFAATAKSKGINAKVVSLDQYRLNDLSKEEYFFAVISTQGDGEPPAAAKKFFDHIHRNGFQLGQLKYSVLALGDTAYPLFCKAGEDIDAQLQKLGGQRLVSLQKCDTDYENDAEGWFNQVLEKLSGNGNSAAATVIPGTITTKKPSGKQIYTGTVLTNLNLNDRGSNKQTHHIEISADEVAYQPGDSLGVVPENPFSVVEAIVSITGVNPDKAVTYRNETSSISDLLKKKLNIVFLPERVVKQYAAIVQQDIPPTNIGLLDLLKIYPVRDEAQFEDVINILEPIAPRLYSISSSPEAHSGEVHITVARNNFTINEELKYGLCSDFLTQVKEEQTLQFYIHKNNRFRLPSPDRDIIMVGPGTGIAPFRSFLAERDATGASGRNWLFFGEQHFATDFLYQTEIQNWVETGVLTNVNVAFSRDQQQKVYVQHKMIKHGEELYKWLNDGAVFYVCGAKDPMSADVEDTLLQIVEQFGNKSKTEAAAYLEQLKEEERFLLDVY